MGKNTKQSGKVEVTIGSNKLGNWFAYVTISGEVVFSANDCKTELGAIAAARKFIAETWEQMEQIGGQIENEYNRIIAEALDANPNIIK